jgi:hypothetical protein
MSGERSRRDVLRALARGVGCLVLALAGHEARAAGPAGPAPRDRAARRRWALARMDEMGRERQRCRERFRDARRREECEAEFARLYRGYNEVYLEAARD